MKRRRTTSPNHPTQKNINIAEDLTKSWAGMSDDLAQNNIWKVSLNSAGELEVKLSSWQQIRPRDFVLCTAANRGKDYLVFRVDLADNNLVSGTTYEFAKGVDWQGLRRQSTLRNVECSNALLLDNTLFIYDHQRKAHLYLGGQSDLKTTLLSLAPLRIVASEDKAGAFTSRNCRQNDLLPCSANGRHHNVPQKAESKVDIASATALVAHKKRPPTARKLHPSPLKIQKVFTAPGKLPSNSSATWNNFHPSSCSPKNNTQNDGSHGRLSQRAGKLPPVSYHSTSPASMSNKLSTTGLQSGVGAPDHQLHVAIADAGASALHVVSPRSQAQNGLLVKIFTRPSYGRIPDILGKVAYRGVTFNGHRWIARIRLKGELKYLGCFDSSIEAAQAYDEAAVAFLGLEAKPNFPVHPSSLKPLYGYALYGGVSK